MSRKLTLLLLGAPLPALAIGILVMVRAGIGTAVWMQNLAAAAVGIGMAAWFARADLWMRGRVRRWLIPASVMALLLTLLAPGLDGVQRWLPVGPVRIHIAAVVLPAMLAVFRELPWRSSFAVAAIVAAVLFAQPDLAQTAAFAAGWGLLSLLTYRRSAIPGLAVVAAIAVATAFRTDPLEPVDHVEGIVGVAFSQSAVLGALALIALVLIPLAFLTLPDRVRGTSLFAYMTVVLAAAWYGHFPVPILGFGASPILGYYLAAAVLLLFRESPSRPRNQMKTPGI